MTKHSCEEEQCACTTIFTSCECCKDGYCDCEDCDICELIDNTESLEEE